MSDRKLLNPKREYMEELVEAHYEIQDYWHRINEAIAKSMRV